jgi:polysaccharide export outer membrane protein
MSSKANRSKAACPGLTLAYAGVAMKISVSLIIVLVSSLLALGQESASVASAAAASTSAPPQASSTNTPWFSQRYPRYEMRPDDSFDVIFEITPEYNQTVVVQPDGFVSMRSVGDIRVEGLTVSQVTDKLREAYGKILNHPMVSIVLKDFAKPYFVVDGQVKNPGKYDLRDDTTVVQAIAVAGAFLPSAKHSQVVLFRRVSDQWTQATLLDVKKMENHRNLAEDIHLQPGDMLFVPKNRFSKISPFIPNGNVSMVPLARP